MFVWSNGTSVTIHLIGYIYMMQMFSFNFRFCFEFLTSFPTRISPRIHLFYKIGYFFHKRSVCREQWKLVVPFTKLDKSIWCWCFLSIFDFDSDSRPHFDPNQSRDSYIFIKFETFSIREVFVRSNGNLCYHSLNWVYLYDADVFFQFSILIRILYLISDPNHSRDSYILIKLDTLSIWEVFVWSNGN